MRLAVWMGLGMVMVAVYFAAYARAQSGESRYGVIHNIAEDREVERVGGIYEPEGLDKYMKRKFDELHGRLDEMGERLKVIEKNQGTILERLSQREEQTTQQSGRPS
jgi:hypothetical protein